MALNFINTVIQDNALQGDSLTWANWMSALTPTTCMYCVANHGKIVDISVLEYKTSVDAHPNCKCVYVPMRTKALGTATDMGMEGADVYLAENGRLPEYYLDQETAKEAGWKASKKKFSTLFPGKMIGGGEFANNSSKLPSAPGRKWYEADINYFGGKRNRQRLLYSNDGLLFVTYDHYHTFYEITK